MTAASAAVVPVSTVPSPAALPCDAGRVSRQRIAALDGLRGLAVVLVMLCHFGEGGEGIILRAAQAGWIGVDLFFVLSGFLITGILLQTRDHRHYFRNFYARRVLRIFPLYYAVLLGVFALAPLLGLAAWLRLERSASMQGWLWTYGTNFGQAFHDDWLFNVGRLRLHHLWSLAVEEHFYMLWPAVVLLCGRRGLAWVCAGLVLSAAGCRVALTVMEASPISIYVLTPCRWDALAIGATLALMLRGSSPTMRMVYWARRVCSVSGAAIVCLFLWRDGLDNINDPLVQTFGLTLLGAFWASVLVLVLSSRQRGQGGGAGRIWVNALLRYLGRISYGLYIFHLPVLSLLSRWIWPARIGDAVGWDFAGYVACGSIAAALSVLLASLSYRLYEAPILRLKHHFGGES